MTRYLTTPLFLFPAVAVGLIYTVLRNTGGGCLPIWYFGERLFAWNAGTYEQNIIVHFDRLIDEYGGSDGDRRYARAIAQTYVETVYRNTAKGGGGWMQSAVALLRIGINATTGYSPFKDFGLNCEEYATVVCAALNNVSATPGANGETLGAWKIEPILDSRKFGINCGFDEIVAARHSYVCVEYKGRTIVFDPWQDNLPQIYEYSEYGITWPKP